MDPENAAIAAEQNAANKRAVAKAARERRAREKAGNADLREVKVDARLRKKVGAAIATWRDVLGAWVFDYVSSAVYLDDRTTHVRADTEIAHTTAYWQTGRDRRFVALTIEGNGTAKVRGGVDRARDKAGDLYPCERLETTVSDDRPLASVLRQIAAFAQNGADGLPPPERVVEIASRKEVLDWHGLLSASGRRFGTHGDTALVAARRSGVQVQRVTCDGAWAVGVLDGNRVAVYVAHDRAPHGVEIGRVGE